MPSATLRMIMVRPPALRLLPRRRTRPGSLVASGLLHAAAMAALVWLPRLFPQPIVIAQEYVAKPEPVVLDEPLALRALPALQDHAPASPRTHNPAVRVASASAPAKSAALPTPDFSAPQTIVSNIANPVSRIQTIVRPDLAAPPKLKFPLRLQSMVILPTPAAPVLAPRPPEPLAEPAPAISPAEAPAIRPSVEKPVLTLTAKKGSVIRASAAPSQTVSPDLKSLRGTQSNAIKALVVVNAVQVAPDPTIAVPEGQLAGKFIVGPSAGGAGAGSSPVSSETENATGTPAGRSPSPGDGYSSTPGAETTAADRGEHGMNISPNPGGAEGTGGAMNGGASGAGSGPVRGPAAGISISGGVPGRRAVTANSFPGRPSYPLMIISGGASGGASRDLGVFNRNETVYSVSIPMADSGGGPDWTMQYALLDASQAGAGLLVPPIAQKKVAANMKTAATSGDVGPVFISAIIDENGKLQALKPVRAQDTRSQAAMHGLEQWEFLPAQLDGKPVASKVLVGVAVHVQQ